MKFNEEFMTNINQNKIIMREIIWIITNDINKITKTPDDELLTDIDKNKVVIPKNKTKNKTKKIRYLTLPIHRFSLNYEVIILNNNEYKVIDIINIINDFYNIKELTLLDLKRLNEDDVYNYIKNATILKKKNPEQKIHYTDIMGDKRYFEGIYYREDDMKDIQYYLLLGS